MFKSSLLEQFAGRFKSRATTMENAFILNNIMVDCAFDLFMLVISWLWKLSSSFAGKIPGELLCLKMKKVLFAAFLGLASAVNDNSLVDSLTNSFEQLKSYYDKTTGFFGDDSMGLPLWTTANQIETTANYYEITKDESALEIFENSYLRLKSRFEIDIFSFLDDFIVYPDIATVIETTCCGM